MLITSTKCKSACTTGSSSSSSRVDFLRILRITIALGGALVINETSLLQQAEISLLNKEVPTLIVS